MKKTLSLILIIMLASCAHQPLKAPKKAPCDFEKQQIEPGYEDNTK